MPLLLDVHDLTSKLFASKFAGRPRLMAAVRMSERAALRFATEVITVHEPYADRLRALDPPAGDRGDELPGRAGLRPPGTSRAVGPGR